MKHQGPPPKDTHLKATRNYYDEFSARYEDRRRGQDPSGYHDLIDDLEVDFVKRFGKGRDVLEVGCGTGLLLERIQRFAKRTHGLDLSPGMLGRARARGLEVTEGSATELPFAEESFDVVCSFKVLAHVREIERALSEMARVLRPGGHLLAEFYNPMSLRGLVKKLGPAGAISDKTKENAVFTRFDSPGDVRRYMPRQVRIVATRGVRIVTPTALVLRIPGLRAALLKAEWLLCDSALSHFGGFWIAAAQKHQTGNKE